MNRDRIAYLINVTYTQDEIGQDVPVENKKKIFVTFQAYQQLSGLKQAETDFKLNCE